MEFIQFCCNKLKAIYVLPPNTTVTLEPIILSWCDTHPSST